MTIPRNPTDRPELLRVMADAIESHMFAPHELPLDTELHAKYLDNAASVLRAIEAAGCVVAPKAATERMIIASGQHPTDARTDYTAMLAAGPFGEG